MLRFLALVIAVLGAALPAATADASRKPTAKESRAIRAAALHSLHGSGWTVSHIRVSTARTANRYAGAEVQNRATGVGGSMILGTTRGHWRRRFLGTDGFCELTNVPHAVLVDLFRCPDVRVSPSRVAAGGTVTVSGRNWPPGTEVEVLLGPPRSEADPVGTATVSSTGRFTHALTINPTLPAGTWVVLGCQNECRVKAGASFTVTGGSR